MSGRGVLFALTPEDAQKLQAAEAQGDAAVWSVIHEEIEERWEREWLFETDKAWDALHRCLTDGKLVYGNGEPPLSLAILGGYQQVGPDSGVVSVTAREDVPAVAEALRGLNEAWLRERYFAIDPEDYATELSEEDFAYTWSNAQGLVAFYARAAAAGRDVAFTVDV